MTETDGALASMGPYSRGLQQLHREAAACRCATDASNVIVSARSWIRQPHTRRLGTAAQHVAAAAEVRAITAALRCAWLEGVPL